MSCIHHRSQGINMKEAFSSQNYVNEMLLRGNFPLLRWKGIRSLTLAATPILNHQRTRLANSSSRKAQLRNTIGLKLKKKDFLGPVTRKIRETPSLGDTCLWSSSSNLHIFYERLLRWLKRCTVEPMPPKLRQASKSARRTGSHLATKLRIQSLTSVRS